MTVPAAVVTGKSRGMMNTDASPAFLHARRRSPLRPYTSSAATHFSGSPAAISRVSWPAARPGFVANIRSSGIPAASRRSLSSAHRRGMYTSKSAQACPPGVT